MSDAYTRREFVHRGLGLVGMGMAAPSFLARSAFSMAPQNPTRVAPEKILVVVQLAGGNDGLNTVIPYRDDQYYKARPGIAIDRDKVLKADSEQGFHPAAKGFKELYDEGLLAVVHAVGYPNPNRSHFSSTDYWASGRPGEAPDSGWLGRYLDASLTKDESPDPKKGIAISKEMPLAMLGKRFSPVTFSSPDELKWNPHKTNRKAQDLFQELQKPDSPPNTDRPNNLYFLQKTALDAQVGAREIREAARGQGGKKTGRNLRGNTLSQQLESVASMIQAGLATRIYYVSLGSFDTHSGQLNRHQNLLSQLAGGLHQFVKSLRESGDLDRVTVMTFSEFGRRVYQNASGGTDHGTAAPMFLIGSHINPGFHGQQPSLTNLLDKGDLKFRTDFRSVYTNVLEDWLGADAKKILGGNFRIRGSLFQKKA